jgi:hypothetical protein
MNGDIELAMIFATPCPSVLLSAFTNVFQATDNNTEGQGVAKIMASSISPFIDWEIQGDLLVDEAM